MTPLVEVTGLKVGPSSTNPQVSYLKEDKPINECVISFVALKSRFYLIYPEEYNVSVPPQVSLLPPPTLPGSLCCSSQHLDSDTQRVLARFSEHYSNVRHFHESLATRLQPSTSASMVDPRAPSRSTLFESLR